MKKSMSVIICSGDTGCGNWILYRAVIPEIVLPDYLASRDGDPPPDFCPVVVVIDHRGLYDMLIQEGQPTAVEERRLAIDLAGIIDLAHTFGDDIDVRDMGTNTGTVG